MRCPYLAKDVIYFCNSDSHAVICGARLKKYCKTASFKSCPRYASAGKAACEGLMYCA